jgi:hypothetical protein
MGTGVADHILNDSDSVAAPDIEDRCGPEVRIILGLARWQLCLGSMAPDNDSCAEVRISGHGMTIRFDYSSDSGWHYEGITGNDSSAAFGSASVQLTSDEHGSLAGVLIHSVNADDSARLVSPLLLNNDLPVRDTTILPHTDLSVQRITRACAGPRLMVEERIWTYPPGYRYRYIPPNYPELSMFHCGGSIRMPTSKSLEKRALMFVEYNIVTLEKLEFDDPEEIMRQVAIFNRLGLNRPMPENKPKKRRRPPLLSLRPLP